MTDLFNAHCPDCGSGQYGARLLSDAQSWAACHEANTGHRVRVHTVIPTDPPMVGSALAATLAEADTLHAKLAAVETERDALCTALANARRSLVVIAEEVYDRSREELAEIARRALDGAR